MLLTDGNPNTTEDLRVYESAVLDVSNGEMINLDTKLTLATEEISEQVLNILLDHTSMALGGDMRRRAAGVSDVVVTRQLKRWHALHTLAIFYRDAFNNQLNDRYQVKWNEYKELARGARETTLRFGIGLVTVPVPEAAPPTLGSAPGLLPSAVYYARVSWVSSTGSEGTPSVASAFETPSGSLLTVANSATPPAIVTGFNVYAGYSADSTRVQNSSPIPLGQTFTIAASGLVTNSALAGAGQNPDYYITGGSLIRRG